MIQSNPGELPEELHLVQWLSHHLPWQLRTYKHIFESTHIFPWKFSPLPYYRQDRAEWCQPRSGQPVPCKGGDKAFISQTQQLPSCVVAGRQKTPFHTTDRNEMYQNLSRPWNKTPCLPFPVHTGECKTELSQSFSYKELAGWDLEAKE